MADVLTVEQWPNKLGWNVGDHEVWEDHVQPMMWVRTWNSDGTPDRWMDVPHGTDPRDAVLMCLTEGAPIDY